MACDSALIPDLIGLVEVAERTSTSYRHVRRLVDSGQLFSVKCGYRRLVPRHAYVAWLASLEQQAAAS